MDTVYRDVAMMLDAVSIILSFSLIYYRIYFRNKKEKGILHIIPFIILINSALDLVSDIACIYEEYEIISPISSYCKGVLQCTLFSMTFQFLIDNMSFFNKKRKKRGYLISAIVFLTAVLSTEFFADLYHKLFFNDTHKFEISPELLGNAKAIIIMFIFILTLISLVICLIKKDKESRHFVGIFYVMMTIYFIIKVAEGNAITSYWAGDGLALAASFSFFFTISNTQFLMAGKEKEAAIAADLNMAQRIQQDAIPKVMPAFLHHQDISINASMNTARDVGGDFYDYFEIDENHICFVIADVSGKGMPASLFMMTAQTMIKTLAINNPDTATIISKADKMLSESNNSMMFVTVWIGIFNTETRELEYTNAGHNPPVMFHADGSMEIMEAVDGTMIGNCMSETYTKECIKMNTGDRIFLYTDGVPEAHNIKDELFGEERMIKVLKNNVKESGDTVLNSMKQYIDAFSADREQFDDITMMMVDFNIPEQSVDSFNGLDFLMGL